MDTSNEFFATAKPTRLFFKVALPGMISMLAMSVYSVIEGAFIGNMLGEAAFAAVNVAMPFVMINFSIADLIGVGSSVPISVSLGHKDSERADSIFSCALILILAASALMGVLLYFTSPMLVRLMGAEGELARLAVKYVRVYAVLGPFTTVLFALDNYLRISGYVKFSMGMSIFMSALTAVLLFLFIGVFKMDVEGSALATASAMAICVFIEFVPFLRRKTVLKFVKPRFSLGMIKDIFACGSPSFLNNIAGRVASITMNSALLRIGGADLGQTAVAAFSVLMYASDIIQPMLYGLSDSLQPAIGYNWGAGKIHRVKALAVRAFAACGIVSLVGTAVMFFLPRQLTSIFVGEADAPLMEMTVHAMKLFCFAYLFRWLGFVTQGFFSAIEKPLPASILSICSAMVFPIIFIFVLSPMGLDGLWLNMGATALLVAVMSVIMLADFSMKLKANKKELHLEE